MYLAELRKSTKELQEEINVFLTHKMEEDKQNAAIDRGACWKKGTHSKEPDEVEEEKYGEENVDEDTEGV